MKRRDDGLFWALLIVGVVIVLMLSGCARKQNDVVDPKAFSFWAVPF